MATTYLDLVNGVLTRLRDTTVSTVEAADEDVLLIGKFVNDALRKVADSHDWKAQEVETDVTTAAAQQEYSLTNTANRAIIDEVSNITKKWPVQQTTQQWYRTQEMMGNTTNGSPYYWVDHGIDANGDNRVRLYPNPTGTETIRFYYHLKPQANMTMDTDSTELPFEPVELLAWAYAARERGEVGGQMAGEIFAIARSSLADAIAYDRGNSEYEDDWYTP
jgi:hypothetical protein